jgi:pyruvate dehydrogenase E2 component (dihydrolipoamide acetyltransferase)
MPALGAGMDVGRIVAWHVKPGDVVHRGDIVALVETDKANIDVEVFEDGVIEQLLVDEGTKVPVGTPLALIATSAAGAAAEPRDAATPELATAATPQDAAAGSPDVAAAATPQAAAAGLPDVATAAAPGDAALPSEPTVAGSGAAPQPLDAPVARPAAAAAPAEVPAAVAPPPSDDGPLDEHPFVLSPLVRRQASDAGVDLTRVRGSGPAGVITRHDVEAAAAERIAAPTAAAPPPATVAAGATTFDVAEPVAAASAVGAGADHAGPAGRPPVEPFPATTSSSPYARRLAADRHLDLGTMTGSGPAGAVIARDVPRAPSAPPAATSGPTATASTEAEPAAPPPQAAPAATAPASDRAAAQQTKDERALAMRLAIARAMERSNREIPHYYLGETVDVEASLRWLADLNAERPPTDRILPAVLVLKATALALQEYPDFNGYWIDDAFVPGEGIHLGVAINLRRGGLLAPAIRDADQRSLDELMAALKDLVARTRSAGLRGSELTDPTITVSNLGDTGVETIQGVITPPQVALVGAGRITERPWAVDGMLAVRRTIYISLAGDHRASDGHRGGRFLGAIAAHLTRAETL